jgi:hypothetical protein
MGVVDHLPGVTPLLKTVAATAKPKKAAAWPKTMFPPTIYNGMPAAKKQACTRSRAVSATGSPIPHTRQNGLTLSLRVIKSEVSQALAIVVKGYNNH